VWPCLVITDAFPAHRRVTAIQKAIVGSGGFVLGPPVSVPPSLPCAETELPAHFSGDPLGRAALIA
jgi:hypothetical protein